MRDPARIPKILAAIEAIWKQKPDWRLGQLISNAQGPGIQDVFYFEDDKLLERLTRLVGTTQEEGKVPSQSSVAIPQSNDEGERADSV